MIDAELSANVTDAWKTIFNKYVGNGRGKPYERLSAETGIPASTLYSIAGGKHKPTSDQLIAILGQLPPGASGILMGLNGYGVHRVEGEGCAFEAARAAADFQAHFHQSISDDGHYDGREWHDGLPITEHVADAFQRLNLGPVSRVLMPYQQAPWMREAGD